MQKRARDYHAVIIYMASRIGLFFGRHSAQWQLMPRFTTRVELQGATREDYMRLQSAMERRGFSRTIKSDEGIVYVLPDAEYDREDDTLTADLVLNDAIGATRTVTEQFSVLVTEAVRRMWSRLPTAK